jgi:hypothetical protein
MSYTYRKGVTTGKPMTFLWQDALGVVTDFSTGFTFAAYIVSRNAPTVLLVTKSTGITGYSTAAASTSGYNVMIDWQSSDFTSLTPSTTPFTVTLVATPSGGDPYAFPGRAEFTLEAAPA